MGIKDNGRASTGQVVPATFGACRPPGMTAQLNDVARRAREASRLNAMSEEVVKKTVGDYLIQATEILRDTSASDRAIAELSMLSGMVLELKDLLPELDTMTREERLKDPPGAACLAINFYSLFYGEYTALQ